MVGLALVAAPAAAAAFLAVAGFSGCFLVCTEPDPVEGALLAGIAMLLLALPLGLGFAVWRGHLHGRAWLVIAVIAALTVTGYFLTRGAI